jgi:hypothetical protein
MVYLVFLLAAYGLAFGVQNKVSFLHGKIRVLDALLRCSYCMGFWTGWVTWGLSWVTMGSPIMAPSIPGNPLQMVTAGFIWAMASTVFCYVLDVIIVRLEDGIKLPKQGDD